VKLSIITPTFNAKDFITACVENVQAQGPSVGEHVIADGGSTDGTLDLLAALSEKYGNVRVLHGPDRGQSDAMNKATDAATGEIIGVLNADDYYEPGAASEAMQLFAEQSDLDFVAANTRILGPNDELIRWNKPRDLRPEILVWRSPHFELPANPSAYFYKKSMHDRLGGYEVANHYTMDIEFIFEALEAGRFRYVDRHWGNFRLIPGTKSFANMAAADPVAEMLNRKFAAFSAGRKLRSTLLYAARLPRVRAWEMLHRLGLK
jgi:glycosyltransferase involved in cell wall biosynthesis